MPATHPELAFISKHQPRFSERPDEKTSVDLIEIHPDRVEISTDLTEEGLLSDLEAQHNRHSSGTEPTRIFLAKSLIYTGKAFEKLKHRFCIPELFFQNIRVGWTKPIQATFLRSSSSERPVTFDGTYDFLVARGAIHSNVWFSQSLTDKDPSTYVIYNLGSQLHQQFLEFYGLGLGRRPSLDKYSIDILLLRLIVTSEVYHLHFEIMKNAPAGDQGEFISQGVAKARKAISELHLITENLHAARWLFHSYQDLCEFLLSIQRRRNSARHSIFQVAQHPSEYKPKLSELLSNSGFDEMQESLHALAAELKATDRLISDKMNRLSVRINLVFNILAQADTKTNLEIAKLTSKISVSTQKDSSSMITIAVLTMFFLPGTFVSSIFGMPFFETVGNGNGHTSLVVSEDWYLFVAVTTPLTVFVFFVWVIWRRLRVRSQRKRLEEDKADDIEAANDLEDENEGKEHLRRT